LKKFTLSASILALGFAFESSAAAQSTEPAAAAQNEQQSGNPELIGEVIARELRKEDREIALAQCREEIARTKRERQEERLNREYRILNQNCRVDAIPERIGALQNRIYALPRRDQGTDQLDILLGEMSDRFSNVDSIETLAGEGISTSPDEIDSILDQVEAELDDIEQSIERREESAANERENERELDKFYNSFGLTAGVIEFNIPQTGFGVNISQDEQFIGQTPGSLTGASYGAEASVGIANIWVTHAEADGSRTASVAEGTDVVGVVLQDLDPVLGTGINLGPAQATVRSHAEFERFEFGGTLSLRGLFGDDGFRNEPYSIGKETTWSWDVNAGPAVIIEDLTLDSFFTTETFAGLIDSSIQQEVDQTYFGGVVGAEATYHFSRELSITAAADGRILRYDAELDSRQTVNCALCPVGGQLVESRIEDEISGWTVGLGLEVESTFFIDHSFDISLSLGYDFIGNTAHVLNPETGDDVLDGETTRLGTDEYEAVRAMLAIRYRF